MSNYETIGEIPRGGMRPISRKALVKCLENMFVFRGERGKKVIKKVRDTKSFDVAIGSSPEVGNMNIKLYKFDGEVPLYDVYCGHAIYEIMVQICDDSFVKYPGFYPSTIRIFPRKTSHNS
jgi:hypothetical protein